MSLRLFRSITPFRGLLSALSIFQASVQRGMADNLRNRLQARQKAGMICVNTFVLSSKEFYQYDRFDKAIAPACSTRTLPDYLYYAKGMGQARVTSCYALAQKACKMFKHEKRKDNLITHNFFAQSGTALKKNPSC